MRVIGLHLTLMLAVVATRTNDINDGCIDATGRYGAPGTGGLIQVGRL